MGFIAKDRLAGLWVGVLVAIFSQKAMGQESGMHDHAHMHQTAAGGGQQAGLWGWVTEVFTPRQQCMNYETDVIWTHVVSDSMIALAYFSIPLALVYLVRRRNDFTFNWVFYFFASFILACGTTHIFNVIAIWYPMYRLDGWLKLATAVASVATAAALWPLIPKLISMPSRQQLRLANQQLEGEISRTRDAEEKLRTMADQLEHRVTERTIELRQANERLQHEMHHRLQVEKEREQLLESERAARSEAERANRMKDEFLATVSHELRTPINAIMGWTQMLRMPRGQAGDFAEALDVIERNTRMQSRLIDDLLDMSRIISGKLQLSLKATDIREVIDAAVETMSRPAAAKEIVIHVETPANLPRIVADPERLQQIVWNLLSNAVKFSSRGGTVTVTAETDHATVTIYVSDRGQGIPKDLLPFVFDRFQQGDSSMTRRHGGLGLGLAIVKNLTEIHGGTVSVRSEGSGCGAEFTVTLPVSTREAGGDENSQLGGEPLAIRLDGISVLVVDDEPDALSMVRRLLEEHGAHVLSARSAAEAMQQMETHVPRVIISDIGMPDEDGYSLIRRIRKLPESLGGKTPAVALTAFARSEDRVNALMSGFQAHLSKPADLRKLLITVEKLAEYRDTVYEKGSVSVERQTGEDGGRTRQP